MLPSGSMRLAKVPYNVGLPAEEILRRGSQQARRLKREMASRGWVSSDDAMYIALRVLREHPNIARAVAGRYGELVVDEAQDTSELQLECLRLLMTTGALQSLVLIGDTEQAIYSFTGASADGCDALASAVGLRRLSFDENYRSSQKICDLAARFCSRPTPDIAVGPDADHAVTPEFVVYPAERPATAVATFSARLTQLGEDPERSAVLARSNDFCSEINGARNNVRVPTRPLALGRAVAKLRGSNTLSRRDIERIDEIVSFAAFDDEQMGDRLPVERAAIRVASIELLASAPALDLDLQAWIRRAATRLTEISRTVTSNPARTGGNVLRSAASHAEHVAHTAFQPAAQGIRAQTIHDIKGESRDAVLIVLDRQRGNREPHSAMWAGRLRGESGQPDEAEEIRIAFVALTRARRYCLIAVPDDSSEQSIAAFADAGLRSIEHA
jgi:superfamily I DNA/RNA helicase